MAVSTFLAVAASVCEVCLRLAGQLDAHDANDEKHYEKPGAWSDGVVKHEGSYEY